MTDPREGGVPPSYLKVWIRYCHIPSLERGISSAASTPIFHKILLTTLVYIYCKYLIHV